SLMRDAAVFTVTFTANADVKLSEVLNFNSRYTAAEAYNADLELMNVELRFNEALTVAEGYNLYQNMPNPFRQETVIGFDLPAAMSAQLVIFDASGRQLQSIEGDYNKGYNQVSLSSENLTRGVLYYQLITDDYTATNKMVKIK
ncbi:MAG: T9SS type A sorting domain-containing protein, partial [Saprospiraceae bacterium]